MEEGFQISVTAEQFNALAAKLKSMGFADTALEGGTLPETRGVVLSYIVDVEGFPPTAATVTFTIQKKPFLATTGMIEHAVKQMMGIA